MTGITDLAILLAEMTPSLDEERYVFLSLEEQSLTLPTIKMSFATIKESEGWTLIVPVDSATQSDSAEPALFQRIELKVNSSLEAVGLTAAVATTLAKENISANVVAAYFHDHIFVPEQDALTALKCLQRLSAQSRNGAFAL
ncbi:MAG: ACT domain-containing protein [Alteromonadaceae bacterium]|nr:ACT domain-containing protein [Alteromonadaceae bacterium]